MPNTANIGYELLVIFSGSLKESELKTGVEKLRKEIEKLGTIKNETIWAARPLAYQIDKDKTGTYLIVNFESAPAKIAEFDNLVRLEPAIIRHVLLKTPKEYVWCDYTVDDLEHDFTKFNRQLFEEEAAKTSRTGERPILGSKPKTATKKTAAADEAMKEKPKETKAKSKAEIEKKLDSILDEL